MNYIFSNVILILIQFVCCRNYIFVSKNMLSTIHINLEQLELKKFLKAHLFPSKIFNSLQNRKVWRKL